MHCCSAIKQGWVKEIDPGSIKSGEKMEVKYQLALNYYRIIKDGISILEIDTLNYLLKVGEHDLLARRREMLGI